MACLLYRHPLEHFLQSDVHEKSTELALQVYAKIAPTLDNSTVVDDSISRDCAIERISRCLVTAFELRVALQLHAKQSRIISFPVDTPYDPYWMVAENADGSPAMASRAELEDMRVSVLLFPALAQLPGEGLEGLRCPDDWERVMPTRKPCLDDEGRIQRDWLCCAKALVILE
jgi:hypothetical protein